MKADIMSKEQAALDKIEMKDMNDYLKMARDILRKPRGQRYKSLNFLRQVMERKYDKWLGFVSESFYKGEWWYFENGIPLNFNLIRFMHCMQRRDAFIDQCKSYVHGLLRRRNFKETITDSKCLLLFFYGALLTDYQGERLLQGLGTSDFGSYIQSRFLPWELREPVFLSEPDSPSKGKDSGIRIVTGVSDPELNHFVQRYLRHIDKIMGMPEGKGQIEALIKLRGNILKCKLPSWIHDKPDVKYFYFDTDSEVVSLVQAGYFDYPRFKKLMDTPEDLKQMHVYIRSVAMFMHGEQEDTSDAVDKLILMILMLNEEILCRQELEELLSGAENEIPSVDLDFPTHFSMVDTDEYLKEVLACLKRIGWVEEGTKAEDWIFRLTGRLPEKDMPSQEPISFLHLNQCRYILKELVFGGMDVSAENYAKAEHVFESLNGSMKNLRSANKKPTGRYEIDKLLKKRRSY